MNKKRKIAVRLCIVTVIFLIAGIIPFSLSEKVQAKHLEDVFPEEAADISKDCVFHVSENEENQAKLVDSSVSTDWTATRDAFIEITSPQRIGSFYIEWNTLPAEWTLSVWEKGTFVLYKKGGLNGFLNEFISIEDSYTRIRISWNKGDKPVSIGRIILFSKGNVPDTIQTWQLPCTKADMLLVSTHADDEHLYFGGTLSTYAGEQKKNVQVAYLINCGVLRTRELLAGLWVVGIKNYPVISTFPDQYAGSLEAAIEVYGYEPVLAYQVMLLRRFRPDVVIGHDLNGEYGHGAHMLNAQTLTQAIDAAKDPSQFPDTAKKYGVWGIQKCYLHLYEKNPVIMDWTIPLKAFNGRSSWEMAKLGYAQHVSQQIFKFIVRIEGPNDCRKFGLYYSSVGEDVLKNDFFENVSSTTISPIPTKDAASAIEISSDPTLQSSDPAHSSNSSDSGEGGIGKNIAGISAIGITILILLLYLVFIKKKRDKKEAD